jgi:succinoglycan biosynthesis protein ExoO
MASPLVSITMPAYNREDSIGRALDSALAQTFEDFEVVVVDDGSRDATLAVAHGYAERDPRVKVFRNERNLGIARTRNHALSRSTGRYITPLDSDDAFVPHRLERLVATAAETGADLVSDDLALLHEGEDEPWSTLSRVCDEELDGPTEFDLADLLQRLGFERMGIALGLTKPLVRRQFLLDHGIEYDTTLQVVEDYWLLADCLTAGARFVMIPEANYVYHQGRQHTTLQADSARDLDSTKRRLEALLARPDITDERARRWMRHHCKRVERLAAHRRLTDLARSHDFVAASRYAIAEPKAVVETVSQVPAILQRRYRRYVRHDEWAYDPIG